MQEKMEVEQLQSSDKLRTHLHRNLRQKQQDSEKHEEGSLGLITMQVRLFPKRENVAGDKSFYTPKSPFLRTGRGAKMRVLSFPIMVAHAKPNA